MTLDELPWFRLENRLFPDITQEWPWRADIHPHAIWVNGDKTKYLIWLGDHTKCFWGSPDGAAVYLTPLVAQCAVNELLKQTLPSEVAQCANTQ